MAYDPGLAERIADFLGEDPSLAETKMFGGLGYMLNGNMCLGIYKELLIVRVGIEAAEQILTEPGVSPMDITGKAMKGWAKIDQQGLEEEDALARYCDLAIKFVKSLPPK